jgi:deoxyadenosine/deoxycytidine kinase
MYIFKMIKEKRIKQLLICMQHFVRRLKKEINKRNKDAEQRIRSNKPKYKLDHIVKER